MDWLIGLALALGCAACLVVTGVLLGNGVLALFGRGEAVLGSPGDHWPVMAVLAGLLLPLVLWGMARRNHGGA